MENILDWKLLGNQRKRQLQFALFVVGIFLVVAFNALMELHFINYMQGLADSHTSGGHVSFLLLVSSLTMVISGTTSLVKNKSIVRFIVLFALGASAFYWAFQGHDLLCYSCSFN